MGEKQPIVVAQPVGGITTGLAEFGNTQGLLLCPVDGHRTWMSGLFDCMDDTTNCILTCLCGPCVLCSLGVRMGECALMPLCVPGAALAMRARLRTLAGIHGTICNDYIALVCCGPCAICQMKREMDSMNLI